LQHAIKVAVVTHARKEPFFCAMWSKFYGILFGNENLYLLKDGDDWDLPPEAKFGNVLRVRFPKRRKACDAYAAEILSQTCSQLLSRYDVILRVDVDEFLIVDPAKGTWNTVLTEVMDKGYVNALGLDIVQNDVVEHGFNAACPVLTQRRHAFMHGGYSKPCAISRPVTWTISCHAIEDGPVILSDALLLVHLASMDRQLLEQRLQIRGDLSKVSYAGHASARLRQFRAIKASRAYDYDVVEATIRERIQMADDGSIARSPRFNTVTLPDGTSHKTFVAVKLPDRFAELGP
jgi:hypothetical protein